MAKLPWMKFHSGDWLKDPALSICSPATRGIWIDLICAMHEFGQSGELQYTADQLARLARCSTAELTRAIDELKNTQTADILLHVTLGNTNVTVVNRRMKREHKSRESSRLRVSRHRRNAKCNGSITPENLESKKPRTRNQDTGGIPPDPLSSAAVASAAGENGKAKTPRSLAPQIDPINAVPIPAALNTRAFIAAWEEWCAYRAGIRKPLKNPITIRAQFRRFEEWGVGAAVIAIETAIANEWQGVFEPRSNEGKQTHGNQPKPVGQNGFVGARQPSRVLNGPGGS